MEVLNYVSIGRILSKIKRDLGTEVHESDMIEWAGEALEHMNSFNTLEQCVAFVEVINHKAMIPKGAVYLNQIAYDTQFKKEECKSTSTLDKYKNLLCPANVIANQAVQTDKDIKELADDYFGCCQTKVLLDCNGHIIDDTHIAYYRPYFDVKYNHHRWSISQLYCQRYIPLRKASTTFYNVEDIDNSDCVYTIQSPYIKTSFKEGSVAISYQRQKVDEEGYPMIPDTISSTTAVTMYITYKLMYRNYMKNVPNSERRLIKAEQDWQWYIKQARNEFMMPDLDDLQDLGNQRNKLIPRVRISEDFFGNQTLPENRFWNNLK